MPARQHSEDEKAVALALLEVNRGAIQKTAQQCEISPRLLKKWQAEAKAAEQSEVQAAPEAVPGEKAEPVGSDGLTVKQRRFVDAYLGAANGNATEAARRAGYAGNDATLASVGYENLRKPAVKQAVERRLTSEAMSANEVIWRLSEQARSSLDDVGDCAGESFTLNLTKAKERGKLHHIRKIAYNQWGDPAVELVDSKAALDSLARIHGLTAQPVEKRMERMLDDFLSALPDDLRAEVVRFLEEADSDADDPEGSSA